MRVPHFSIRSRLSLFGAGFTALVIALAAICIVRLIEIDHKTERLAGEVLTSTQILGELSDRISEFRLSETYRALTPNAADLPIGEDLARTHIRVIEELLQNYRTTMGPDADLPDLETFRTAWNTYIAAHEAWVKSDPNGTADAPAMYGGALHRLYRATDNAIDALVDANEALAHAEGERIDRLVDQTVDIAYGATALVLILTGWLLFRVRTTITEPLAAITRALTRLASGDREVEVPERLRDDEIGAMAKAFDVFRGNALALEKAHAATREAQEQAQALARHDALTGLPNRRLFAAELQTGIARAQSGAPGFSVMILDLDQFKQINDLQGHAVGDLVLCEVAHRLNAEMRKGDTAARLGGDEFAIIAETEDVEGAVRLAGRILQSIREPIRVGEGRVEMSASIGIAACPADGTDGETLMRAADIAMYRAKHDGRNTFRFFEAAMDEELRNRAELEADLRKAIAAGDIRPNYQPLIDMDNQRVLGFEVLARWMHPTRGAVPPDVFIPMAEQLGLISELTVSILSQACRDAAAWPPETSIAVNISTLQLRDATLPTQILSILNRAGFPPSRLEIEVTETALVTDIETARQVLTALQSVGIKVSLDDFGTGYSSLYHLRALAFDKVKIDRSFVQSMRENGENEKIVDAILGLAKSIGLPTVAEGIEDGSVMEMLKDKGCEYGQGYYLGRAMSAERAAELLRKGIAQAGAESAA